MPKKRRPKVLLVDDDRDSRDLYHYILRWGGFEVLTAADGDEALRQLDEHPDVVVLDIQLPRRNGFEILEDLRRLPSAASVPVIALTGYADAAYRARTVSGFADVLEKPCDANDLIGKVRQALGAAQAP